MKRQYYDPEYLRCSIFKNNTMKKSKKKLESFCKESDCECNCKTKCWVSHMVDFHYGDESVYDKFSIPLGVTSLSGFRFILPVTPSGSNGMAGWLMLEYESDVQNANFTSTANEHGLYSHRIAHKDLDLAAVTQPHLIDESFSFDLEFASINVQTLNVVYLVEGKKQGVPDVHPIVSFEFNCPKLCKSAKKVFNLHF